MDQFKLAVTKTLPKYLESLPLPDTVEGFQKLTTEEIKLLLPAAAVALILFYATISLFMTLISSDPKPRVNSKIDLKKDKVVDIVKASDKFPDVEKLVFCRCWKSNKWPYCDGSHVAHNKATGDNTGCVSESYRAELWSGVVFIRRTARTPKAPIEGAS